MLQLIAKRETVIHRASELVEFARTVEIGEILNHRTDTTLIFLLCILRANEFSTFKITNIFLRSREDRPVTGIEVFGICSFGYRSAVRISRGRN